MRRTPLILATIVLIALTMGCSGTPTNCPEMGIITGVESTADCLSKDNRVGSAAPNFTWETIDCKTLETIPGKTTSLSSFRGKPVMVIFHKTMNCPGCKAQMPFVRNTNEQRTNKDLVVLTVYRCDDASAVRRFVASQGYVFPALADPKDEFAIKCGFPVGAPITIFIDASGTIKAEKIGPFQSQEEIETILRSL